MRLMWIKGQTKQRSRGAGGPDRKKEGRRPTSERRDI